MFSRLLTEFAVRCRREFEYAQDALKTSSWNFFQEHVEAWRKTWEKGHLEVILSAWLL